MAQKKVRSLFKLPFVIESTSVQPVAHPKSRFNPLDNVESRFDPKPDLESRFNPVGKPDCNVLQEAFDAKG
jgi:hypothetical protein